MNKTIDHYHKNAEKYHKLYESLSADEVHADWASILQKSDPGKAMDIGAGSGRDSTWLAQLGWEVTAVEPAANLRLLGKVSTGSEVNWIDSQLPELKGIEMNHQGFDLILLSAVWMHLEPSQHPLALKRMKECLSLNGMIILTLRFGSADMDRPMYAVDIKEIVTLADQNALVAEDITRVATIDQLGRSDVSWKTLILRNKG